MLAIVLIHLRIDEGEPPRGQLWADDQQPASFSGWLDLLRVLSELLTAVRPRP